MTDVSIRELRNEGGKIVDRVEAGEQITITRDGRPVAELRPVRKPTLTSEELVARRRGLPIPDYKQMRADMDEWIDPSL